MVRILGIRFKKNLGGMFIRGEKHTHKNKTKQKQPNFVFRSCISKYPSQQRGEVRYSSKGMVKQIQLNISNRGISERQAFTHLSYSFKISKSESFQSKELEEGGIRHHTPTPPFSLTDYYKS